MSNQNGVTSNVKLDDLITVIISTKNRWPDLHKALLSLRNQSLKHQVLVLDDHSDDGTYENVKQLFPEVTLYTYTESAGYIVRRNEAVKLAQTPYVLSIDDDCALENPNILCQIAQFCISTDCAAVAWPYIDITLSPAVRDISPGDGLWQSHTFKGCSFVVKREIFLKIGGFRTSFFHQGEEEDYCIRLLEQGYPVFLGKGNAIHHYESPKRSWERMDFYGSRNLMLFAIFNVPLIYLPAQLVGSAIKSFLYGFKIRRPYHKSRGVLYGFLDGFKLAMKERKPVSTKTYLKYRELKKQYQPYAKGILFLSCSISINSLLS